MARIRNTPETQPSITADRIVRFGVAIAYKEDGTPDPQGTTYRVSVAHLDAAGAVVDWSNKEVKFSSLPQPLKIDLKAGYQKTLALLENAGLIGAGTDTDDLP